MCIYNFVSGVYAYSKLNARFLVVPGAWFVRCGFTGLVGGLVEIPPGPQAPSPARISKRIYLYVSI